MSRVVHFEIHADDLERAKAFYSAVFAWTYQDYSQVTGTPYWGVVTGPEDQMGINGGLMPREGATPSDDSPLRAYVCTIGVADIDATEASIVANGGQVVTPKAALPGMAWQAYYADTEGNVFGVHQPDPDAR
jgi:uncharacterized protein